MIRQKQMQIMGKEIQKILWRMVRDGDFKLIQSTLKRYFEEAHMTKRDSFKLSFVLDLEKKPSPGKQILVQRIFLAWMYAFLSPSLKRRPEFLGKTIADSRNALRDPIKKEKLLRLLNKAKLELGTAFALNVAKAYKPCKRCKGTGVRL